MCNGLAEVVQCVEILATAGPLTDGGGEIVDCLVGSTVSWKKQLQLAEFNNPIG